MNVLLYGDLLKHFSFRRLTEEQQVLRGNFIMNMDCLACLLLLLSMPSLTDQEKGDYWVDAITVFHCEIILPR